MLDGVGVLGELGLDGAVRPVAGTLALVDALARAGVESRHRARRERGRGRARARRRTSASPRTLGELRACLKGEAPWPDPPDRRPTPTPTPPSDEPLDLADVRGLADARPRARGRRGRRPPPAARRAARRRQDDARPPPPHDPARRSTATRRSRSPASTPPPATHRGHGLRPRPTVPRPAPHRVDRRARRRRQRPRRDRARSRSRTAACSSSTSSASSRRTRSRRCANRSRSGSCASAARRAHASSSRPTSCSSPARTRARAGRADRDCRAPTSSGPATGAGCRRRCSTASTSGCDVAAARTRRRRAASRPRSCASACAAAVERQRRAAARARRGGATRTSRPARSAGAVPLDAEARRRVARPRRGRDRSPGAARRASAASPARSPTSTTRRPSPPAHVDRSRRCCARTCREHADTGTRDRRTSRPRRSSGARGHDAGAPAARWSSTVAASPARTASRASWARPGSTCVARARPDRQGPLARVVRRLAGPGRPGAASRRCSRPGGTRVWLDGRRRATRSRRGTAAGRSCSWPRARPIPTCSEQPRVGGRRHAGGDAARARRRPRARRRTSPSRGHRRERARDRHRRRRARRCARRRRRRGRRRRDRARRRVPAPPRRALPARPRGTGSSLGETGFGIRPHAEAVPGPQPDHRRAGRRGGRGRGDAARRCPDHGGVRRASTDARCFAVPGSRRNASAEGTNALLADGAEVLLDWSDVVLALGLTPAARRTAPARALPSPRRRGRGRRAGGRARDARPVREPDEVAARARRDGDRRAGTHPMGPAGPRLGLAVLKALRSGRARCPGGVALPLRWPRGLQPVPDARQAQDRHRDRRRGVRDHRGAARLGLLRVT